ncbi:hypothetical protein RJ641_027340 [Dillenia turbinata]|uniref:Uncharacterized protein n=1 Tax=Dillenia turbinata TaxID=194707 RepID=A0AAN8VW14_9MAGN
MTLFRSGMNVALGIICILLTTMSYCLNADLAQDKKEGGNQLASPSPCLDFVEGKSKAPDQNDTNLGFKVNATLALSLPFICHAPANISDCPGKFSHPLHDHKSL